jgi:phenylalanyl-tRNA synthetase beta subunit
VDLSNYVMFTTGQPTHVYDAGQLALPPWTTDHLLADAGFDKEQTVLFDGASAPDRNSLRPSLLPNLLEAVASNLRYRPALGIFEAGTVFSSAKWESCRGRYEALPGSGSGSCSAWR